MNLFCPMRVTILKKRSFVLKKNFEFPLKINTGDSFLLISADFQTKRIIWSFDNSSHNSGNLLPEQNPTEKLRLCLPKKRKFSFLAENNNENVLKLGCTQKI